jgi:molecular chaperone GrpE
MAAKKSKKSKKDVAEKSKNNNPAAEVDSKEGKVDVKVENDPVVELEDMKKQYDELKDKYLRLFADFENYKKRTVKDKLDMMKTAAQDTLSALLPVLDDFDRAGTAAEQSGNADSFNAGIGLIVQKLTNTLGQKGLKVMETDGVAFDPELHEAITEIPAPSKKLKGHIVDTIEKGYYLNDKIIRHAKVVVGK